VSLTKTQEQIQILLGTLWTTEFEPNFAEAWTLYLASSQETRNRFLDQLKDYTSVDKIPSVTTQAIRTYVFEPSNLTSLAYNAEHTYNSGQTYDSVLEAQVYTATIDPDTVPSYLAPSIRTPAVVWELGVHYSIDAGVITFFSDPSELATPELITDEDGVTTSRIKVWGFHNELDLKAVWKLYGSLVQIHGESSELYRQAVQIAWDLKVIGANDFNTNRTLSFLTGADSYTGPGNEPVLQIFTEGDHICVVTDAGLYSAPNTHEVAVEVDQVLQKGDQLFLGYTEFTYSLPAPISGPVEIADGITVLFGGQSLYFRNNQVPITKEHRDTWTSVSYTGTAYNVLDVAGSILQTLLTADEATLWIQNNIPEDIYTFEIGGDAAVVSSAILQMNDGDFFDQLFAQFGRVPISFIPAVAINDFVTKGRLTVYHAKYAADRQTYVPSLLKALRTAWPAGSMFLLYADAPALADGYTTGDMSETLEFFLAAEPVDSHSATSDYIVHSTST